MQPHYIYSPREMTRWVRGICEALKPLETLSIEGLVRLWAHEALRLFQDRWDLGCGHTIPDKSEILAWVGYAVAWGWKQALNIPVFHLAVAAIADKIS